MLLIAIAIVFIIKNKRPVENNKETPIVLYYGETCPHCKIVESFLKENKIAEKVDFNEKEVFLNKKNYQELSQKATFCKIDPSSIGVPLLWDGSRCFSGSEEIINFFKEKIDTAPQEDPSSICEANKKNADSELKSVFEKSNYCNADSDCIDIESMLSCPFDCKSFLVNKNADIESVREITKKYYSTCPECPTTCSFSPPRQEEIVCRDKKCIENRIN